ncbi:MAG: winged helix-turn-helix domain-containing protein, partial [Ilumatobacteraceae bacterium]
MKITDVRVLAALAHPTRLAILHLLLTVGDATATQCAAVVGESASSCSYHLRHLARFGLVERVELGPDDAVDGRTRRWRSVASGFDFGEPHSTGSPELVAATAALTSVGLDEN